MSSLFQANEASKEHTKKLAATEKQLVMARAKLQQTNDENEILKNDLERSQNRLTEQDEDIRNLNRQLQIQQQQSNDINEHLLIKDAEVRIFITILISNIKNVKYESCTAKVVLYG